MTIPHSNQNVRQGFWKFFPVGRSYHSLFTLVVSRCATYHPAVNGGIATRILRDRGFWSNTFCDFVHRLTVASNALRHTLILGL